MFWNNCYCAGISVVVSAPPHLVHNKGEKKPGTQPSHLATFFPLPTDNRPKSRPFRSHIFQALPTGTYCTTENKPFRHSTLQVIIHQSRTSHSGTLPAAKVAPCCPTSPRHTFPPHSENHLPTSLIPLPKTDQGGIEPRRHRIATWYITSVDWFKGKITGKSLTYFMRKSMVSCRFSL